MTPQTNHPPEAPGLNELSTLARDCAVSGVARRVLLLRADLLDRPHHRRLAEDALEPLAGADRARRHHLPHGRVAFSWKGEAETPLRRTFDALSHLLDDAPPPAPAVPELARLFDLPRDGAALLALAGGPTPSDAAPPRTEPPRPALAPLDLATLDLIEARLASANVARFARRRPIFRGPDLAWESRFLSVRELTGELCPGRDPLADPWLFRRLTRIFDRRMLVLLSSMAELRDAGPFGLDLNVGGVLSPEFLRFDGALPARLRGRIVLHLHPTDIMADLPAFRFAAAFARARGHLILLRGITPPLLGVLDIEAIAPDYIELRWSPEIAGLDPAALHPDVSRWVLTRADEQGRAWANAVGIPLVSPL